jgi:hypothetical protein
MAIMSSVERLYLIMSRSSTALPGAVPVALRSSGLYLMAQSEMVRLVNTSQEFANANKVIRAGRISSFSHV